MKKLLFLAIVVAGFAACNPTRVVNSWKDPNTTVQNPGANKVVVAALIWDQGVRMQVEDYMASLYPGQATPSYTIIGGDSLLKFNEQYYTERLLSQGYDGIAIMRQTAENTQPSWVPGTPGYVAGWGGYWGGGWGRGWNGPYGGATYFPGTPGHYQLDRTWFVQMNVFALSTNKLIYSANTQTTDPGGRVPLFEDVCKAIKKQMKTDGFLK